jgi:hypothetical protein
VNVKGGELPKLVSEYKEEKKWYFVINLSVLKAD